MFYQHHRYGAMSIAVAFAATVLQIARADGPPVSLRQTEIHGLAAILGPDGVYHGKMIDIVATPGADARVHFVENVGADMQTSLNEAVRMVRTRHDNVQREPLEISFGDKYSSKDGGSAGAAFTVLILAANGDFEISPDVAMTGDITVDGKIRTVGAVAAKIHGAALDHAGLVAIPAEDLAQVEDAILLDGPSSLWEIPIFSMDSLDDAIALVRKDRDAKLGQALKLFADLKKDYAEKPIDAIKDGDPANKLAQMLALKPNFLSAKYLQQLAAGKKPDHLSLVATVQQALAALGTTRQGLSGAVGRGGQPVSDQELEAVKKGLGRIKAIGDPTAVALFDPLNDFVDSYVKFSNVPGGAAGVRDRMSLRQEVRNKQAAIREALETILSDHNAVDKLLH